jgi:molybdopterin-binding protein
LHGALVAQRENPGQQIVSLPEPLAVGADYGMTVMNDSPPAAYRFALFIVSAKGQQILGEARICRARTATRRTAMKISARNIIKGKVVEITKGATTAHVKIDIGGQVLTSAITNEAVDALKLAKGQEAYAVIKASDVMVAID